MFLLFEDDCFFYFYFAMSRRQTKQSPNRNNYSGYCYRLRDGEIICCCGCGGWGGIVVGKVGAFVGLNKVGFGKEEEVESSGTVIVCVLLQSLDSPVKTCLVE
jgi:hypothetical protein